MMDETIEVEFEINKVLKFGGARGFIFERKPNLSLLTFDVFDECLDHLKIATIQWTSGSWACIAMTKSGASTSALGALLRETKSPYFWEMIE